jgi:hypothetical protein
MFTTRKSVGAWLAVAACLVLFLASCANQPPAPPQIWGRYPGFFYGLFHGLIAPFALIGSLFTGVNVYEWPNNGAWYNFGFLLGGPPWLLGAIIVADR